MSTKCCDLALELTLTLSKVFSGCIPFHHLPYNGSVRTQVLRHKRPERPVEATNIGLTDIIWSLIEKCWAQDAKQRPSVELISRSLYEAHNDAESAADQWNSDLPSWAFDAGEMPSMELTAYGAYNEADFSLIRERPTDSIEALERWKDSYVVCILFSCAGCTVLE